MYGRNALGTVTDPSAAGYAIWADVIFEALIAAPSVADPVVGGSLQASGA